MHPSQGPKHPLVSVFPAWMARPGQVGAWSGAAPRVPQDGEGPCCSRESPEETCVFTSGKENFLPREEGWDRRAATGLSLLAGVTVEG